MRVESPPPDHPPPKEIETRLLQGWRGQLLWDRGGGDTATDSPPRHLYGRRGAGSCTPGKDRPILGAGRAELRVPLRRDWTGQARGEPQGFPQGSQRADAGHPVGKECEDGHEQREHHRAALRVALQLLQEPQQPQQPHGLQQVHQRGLWEGRREGGAGSRHCSSGPFHPQAPSRASPPDTLEPREGGCSRKDIAAVLRKWLRNAEEKDRGKTVADVHPQRCLSSEPEPGHSLGNVLTWEAG